MADKKEGDVLETPLLKKREEVELVSVNSMPSIAIVPSRPSGSKNHHHILERESTENSNVSLHQVNILANNTQLFFYQPSYFPENALKDSQLFNTLT